MKSNIFETMTPPWSQSLRVVGQAMYLTHEYDRDQLWFPFMAGTLLEEPLAVETKPGQLKKRKYARMSAEDKLPYLYEEGVDQYCLPFEEFKALDWKEFKRLARAGYPTWDRTSADKPLWLTVQAGKLNLSQWARDSLSGRYYIGNQKVGSWSSICVQQHVDATALMVALRAELAE